MLKLVVQFTKTKKLVLGEISLVSVLKKKIITTGDGGMICLNDKKNLYKIKSLSFHGWNVDPWTRHKNSFYSKRK